MSEYLHVKVKYLRQMDNGLIKKITEQYLVDAMSFTEAEARVLQEVGEGMREVTMMAVSRSPIKEVVFYGDTDMFFKCKVTYSTLDEATEKEKKVTTYLLVNANNVHEAYERTEEHLKDMLVPFQIPKIEESPIIEVFEYQKQAPAGYVKVQSTDIAGHSEEPDYDSDEYKDGMRKAEDELNFDDEDDREEECAMESDTVESRVHPIFEPLLKPIHNPPKESDTPDPTQGQAIGFDLPDDLLSILDEEDLNLTVGQLQRITEQAEALPQAEFISWIGVTFEVSSRVALEIWQVLNDK